jgi:hypothetical protein
MWVPEEFQAEVPPPEGTPIFRNITVRNLTVTNAASAGRIIGLTESPIKNLRLENVRIEARQGFTIRHTKGLQFVDVKLNGEALSAAAFGEESVQKAAR